MKLELYNLIFEVTRRCNLRCEHCLRGDAQNLDLNTNIVDLVLDHVQSISILTLSGGEPTLNMPVVRYIFDEIRRRKIPLDSFFVVTNGIENQMELAQLLLEVIPYCNEPDMCGVAASMDIFHDNVRYVKKSPIHYLSFYRTNKEMGDYYGMKSIIRRGRATSEEFSAGRIVDPRIDFYEDMQLNRDGSLYFNSDFYVSAAGEICADCDMSYDMMKDYLVTMVEDLPYFLKEMAREAA